MDAGFDPGSSVNDRIHTIAVQEDGKILVGGSFSTFPGTICNGLVRLRPDGSVDESFSITLTRPSQPAYYENPRIFSLALQGDGKILVAGSFSSVNGVPRGNLARLDADGTLDESFLHDLQGTDGFIVCMRLQNDGRIVIGGDFTSVNGIAQTNLARLNPDGSLDNTFLARVTGPDVWLKCIAIQSDGKILVGGLFPSVSGVACTNLARLNPDGSLDDSFNVGIAELSDYVTSIEIQTNGQILVAGMDWTAGVGNRANVVRLNADGTPDNSLVADMDLVFNPPGDPEPLIALQPDGKILIGGGITTFNGVACTNLVRLNVDGTLDDSFSPNAYDPPNCSWHVVGLVCQPDGRILVGSERLYEGYPGLCLLRRLHMDGSMDPSFDIGFVGVDGEVFQVTPQPDGRILIGGSFISVNGIPRGHLARLMPDGSLDTAFLNGLGGADSDVRVIVLQDDGKILVGGAFGTFNSAPHPGIVRLNPDGSLDSSFLDGLAGPWNYGQFPGYVYALGLQSDGKILIGGAFMSVNGVPRDNLARLFPDGSLDESFLAGTGGRSDSSVQTLSLQPDGRILVGGSFATVNGVARNRIARLNTGGSLDSTFLNNKAGADQTVLCMAVLGDGKIIIGGLFDSVNGLARRGFARLNPDGSLDGSCLSVLTTDYSEVWSLALPGDGKVLVGGRFSTNGTAQVSLARFNANGSVDDSCLVTCFASNYRVDCVALQGDGKILMGGLFTAVDGFPRSFIARLLSDYSPPLATLVPQGQTAEARSSISFDILDDGYPPPTYQWFFNNTNLVGCSTDPWLEWTNCDFSQSGAYTVVASNVFGTVTSAPITLNVIAAVERRPAPVINMTGEAGSLLNVDYAESLNPVVNWLALDTVSLTNTPQFYFDLTSPLPARRFYRVWQTGTPTVVPSLDLHIVPAIMLAGNIGETLRLDYINAIGPTDAWVTLESVTLTNMSQPYIDTSSIGQPRRLYRIVPTP